MRILTRIEPLSSACKPDACAGLQEMLFVAFALRTHGPFPMSAPSSDFLFPLIFFCSAAAAQRRVRCLSVYSDVTHVPGLSQL
jgi:hypothetical protein